MSHYETPIEHAILGKKRIKRENILVYHFEFYRATHVSLQVHALYLYHHQYIIIIIVNHLDDRSKLQNFSFPMHRRRKKIDNIYKWVILI